MNGKIPFFARLLLGLIYFVFGLNGFLQFIPAPPNMPEGAMAFMGGMMAAPYFFPVLKGTEVICGALLLSGMWSPLALVILAPITLQILLFHGFMTPGLENVILPLVMVALHVVAASGYKGAFKPLLARK